MFVSNYAICGKIESRCTKNEEAAVLAKICETNFSVSVKLPITWKVQFQFLTSFLLVLKKISFWEEDWAPGFNSMKIWDLLDIS